jgi:hypothetical protein
MASVARYRPRQARSRCGRGELGYAPRGSKGKGARALRERKERWEREGSGLVACGGRAGGSSHGVGHEAKAAPSQEWQCQASGVRTARREERERDAKVASGPPGEWGPATEGEKKGREGDRWDRLRVGPSGRERRERALTGGPLGLNEFDLFQTHSNLIWSKHDPPVLQKFDIKYGWKVFATRNNLVHRNLFRIRMDFELKFR